MERRTKQIDPDFRPEPKTNFFCARCQKDIHGEYRLAYIVASGFEVLHPSDAVSPEMRLYEDSGWLPIGMDCARRIGLEWSFPVPQNKEPPDIGKLIADLDQRMPQMFRDAACGNRPARFHAGPGPGE